MSGGSFNELLGALDRIGLKPDGDDDEDTAAGAVAALRGSGHNIAAARLEQWAAQAKGMYLLVRAADLHVSGDGGTARAVEEGWGLLPQPV